MDANGAPGSKAGIRSQGTARKPRERWKRRAIETSFALILAPFVVWYALRAITRNQGLARVEDDEVAVAVDYARGTQELVTTPGYRTYWPWAEEVFRFDKSPNAFVMKGNSAVDANHVPRLLVRARDGSSFWFDEFTIQYALMPDRAPFVLEDSGPADRFKSILVRAHARSILRDEFGRFSAEDVVRPENIQAANLACKRRLNEALQPHGIEVHDVTPVRLGFDKEYESMIARRKVGVQEIEILRTAGEKVPALRAQREELVRIDKQTELRILRTNLVRDIAAAERDLQRARVEADIVYEDKVSQGRMAKLERETQARVLTDKYIALAGDVKAHAELIALRGRSAVRAALVRKLAGIEFNLVPYSRDPAPRRVENETAAWLGKQ